MIATPARGPAPVTDSEFARLIAACGPFEPSPRLALACSGGPDSMALLRLAASWARAHDGAVVALVVDHGLRAASKTEARAAAGWARDLGAESVVLTREAKVLAANIQAEARAARYRLLADWCARHGVLHLLVAHHRDDQAETVLLRLGRDSGVDGLAGMAPVTELPEARLLRPLLEVPKVRLAETVAAFGLPSVADPSNDDTRFARVRVRRRMPELAAAGLAPQSLSVAAHRMGEGRTLLDRDVARLLARSTEFLPEGYALLDTEVLGAACGEVALRALSRLLAAIGGRRHPPRRERVRRLRDAIVTGTLGGGPTLSGCRVAMRRGRLLVCGETGTITDAVAVADELLWDGRFRIACRGAGPDLEIRKLGQAGWRHIVAGCPELRKVPIPPAVRPTLPAVWGLERVLEVPHLSFACYADRGVERVVREVRFAPFRPIQATRFTSKTSRSTLGDRGREKGARTDGREHRST